MTDFLLVEHVSLNHQLSFFMIVLYNVYDMKIDYECESSP